MAGVKLAVLDDGQFVRTYSGTIHPVSATFHRFVEAVARTGRFASVRYIVPVRPLRIWEADPALPEVDQDLLQIVPTRPFGGIADYVLRAGYLVLRNWRPISKTVRDADLLWLRLPASNALLAQTAARRAGVAQFGWLAGSAADVARAQRRPAPLGWAAHAIGAAYDATSELAGRRGPLIRLDADMFSSVISGADVADTWAGQAATEGPPWRLVWAGRVVEAKGLTTLIEALQLLLQEGCDVELRLLGDGPARTRLEQQTERDFEPGRVHWLGYIGAPAEYMAALRTEHVLVHPSPAEGVPKVLLEAMAAGVPIVAADSGAVSEILGRGERGWVLPPDDARSLADGLRALIDDPSARASLRGAGLDWAATHTAEHLALRLVGWLAQQFPELDW